MKLHQALFLAAAAAVGLAGCGGGDYTEPAAVAPSNEVPASATASTSAYISYAASLKASETDKPLEVNKVLPPTSETEKPLAI